MNHLFTFFLILILFAGSHFSVFGQGVKVDFGPEIKVKGMTYISQFVGHSKENIYAIRSKNRDIFFEKYDKKYEQSYSSKLDRKDDALDNARYSGTVNVGGNVYMLFNAYDKKSRTGELWAFPVDLKTGFMGTKKYVLDKYTRPEKVEKGSFEYSLNKSGDLLIVCQNVPTPRKAKEKVSLTVFDADLNKVWNNKAELPYSSKNTEMVQFELSPQGTIYLMLLIEEAWKESEEMAKQKEKNKDEGKRTPRYFFSVLAFEPDGSKFTEYLINLKTKFPTDVILAIDEEENILASGFYADKPDMAMNGTFLLKINGETKEPIKMQTKPFSVDLLADLMSERAAAKGRGLRAFDLRLLATRSDGGYTMVAEQFFITYSDRQQGLYTIRTTTYFHNHILVFGFDAEGALMYSSIIPKKQVYSYATVMPTLGVGPLTVAFSLTDSRTAFAGCYSSFAYMNDGENLFIFYNDNEKNLAINDPKKVKRMSNAKGAIAVMATVNAKGKVTREFLFKNKEAETIFYPRTCLALNEEEVVFACMKGTKHKMMHVSIKK